MRGIDNAQRPCRSRPEPPARDVDVWHQVGAWKGRGFMQTETFTGDTGAFRITWETRNETAPGAGRLYAVFRSGDSGREIMDAVKTEGVGRGVEHVSAERPRVDPPPHDRVGECRLVDHRGRADSRSDSTEVARPALHAIARPITHAKA